MNSGQIVILPIDRLSESAALKGAAMVEGANNDGAALPAAARDGAVLGVNLTEGTHPSGAVSANTDRVTLLELGLAAVLIAPNNAISRGDQLEIADTTGRLQPRTPFGPSSTIIAEARQALASNASAKWVEGMVRITRIEHCEQVSAGLAYNGVAAIGATTKYLVGPGVALASEARAIYCAWAAFKIRNLKCSLTTAPGGSDTVIFTVQKSSDGGATWADTALTVTISAAGITGVDTTHAVTLAAGDLLAVKAVSSAGTAAGPFATFQVT